MATGECVLIKSNWINKDNDTLVMMIMKFKKNMNWTLLSVGKLCIRLHQLCEMNGMILITSYELGNQFSHAK